jgi:hypothetical protein
MPGYISVQHHTQQVGMVWVDLDASRRNQSQMFASISFSFPLGQSARLPGKRREGVVSIHYHAWESSFLWLKSA